MEEIKSNSLHNSLYTSNKEGALNGRARPNVHVRDLPQGWDVKAFGEIVILSQYGLSDPSIEQGAIPMLRMNSISDGKLDLSDTAWIDLSESNLEKYRIDPGDLLFNRTNSYDLVGKTALFKAERSYVCASYLIRFKLDTEKVSPGFVNYIFNSPTAKKQLKSLATRGVSQANINPTTLQKFFHLVLPPLPEQRKIVRILNSWDQALEQIDALIRAKKKSKKGLMQRLLKGEARFPEFENNQGSKKTQIGLIPKDWGFVEISDLAKEVKDKNTSGLDLPVLSCTKHDGLVRSSDYFGKQVFSRDTSGYKLVSRNSFAYATNHIEEGSIGYQDLCKLGLVSPMYTVFKTYDSVEDKFLYRLLKTETYRQLFEKHTNASVNRRGSLRWKAFSSIKVPLPSIEEQQRINTLLDTVDLEIELLTAQQSALAKQKQGLMQQLLTGKVRVAPDEKDLILVPSNTSSPTE